MRRPSQLRYVAFGDSITFGLSSSASDKKYVYLLSQKLDTVIDSVTFLSFNSGVSGNTSLDLLKRVEKDVLAHEPSVITVMIGTNDIRANRPIDDFYNELSTVIDIIKNNISWCEIFLATPPYMTSFNLGNTAIRDSFNSKIVQIAIEKSVNFVDMYNLTKDISGFLSGDGFHPSDIGHQAISDIFFDSMDAIKLNNKRIYI